MSYEYSELRKFDFEKNESARVFGKYVKLIYKPHFSQESCDSTDNTCVLTALNNLFQNRFMDWPLFTYTGMKGFKDTDSKIGFNPNDLKRILESQNVNFKEHVYFWGANDK